MVLNIFNWHYPKGTKKHPLVAHAQLAEWDMSSVHRELAA